jgi:peptidoglycan/xylan/chitin deacetylase (PgdA/CDA1 family)
MDLLRLVGTIALLVLPSFAQSRSIAITFDDLPYAQDDRDDLALEQKTTANMTAAVKKHHVPSTAFVNENKVIWHAGQIDAHVALLNQWMDAGAELGNHNFGHVGLTAPPLARVEDAVIQGEPIIRQLMERRGQKLRYYRQPMMQTGPTAEIKTAFDKFLADRGYTVAPFTIEDSDWVFSNAYGHAREKRDPALRARVRQAYLEYFAQMMDWYEQVAQDTFGRPIAHIIIVHADEINGDSLEELLTRLETRGYKFISLDEALRDPAYQTPDGYIGRYGPSYLHRWRISLGKPNMLKDEPDPPKWVMELSKARRGN